LAVKPVHAEYLPMNIALLLSNLVLWALVLFLGLTDQAEETSKE
jgi:hypothetical protein